MCVSLPPFQNMIHIRIGLLEARMPVYNDFAGTRCFSDSLWNSTWTMNGEVVMENDGMNEQINFTESWWHANRIGTEYNP